MWLLTPSGELSAHDTRMTKMVTLSTVWQKRRKKTSLRKSVCISDFWVMSGECRKIYLFFLVWKTNSFLLALVLIFLTFTRADVSDSEVRAFPAAPLLAVQTLDPVSRTFLSDVQLQVRHRAPINGLAVKRCWMWTCRIGSNFVITSACPGSIEPLSPAFVTCFSLWRRNVYCWLWWWSYPKLIDW